jgi:hypothetical protein
VEVLQPGVIQAQLMKNAGEHIRDPHRVLHDGIAKRPLGESALVRGYLAANCGRRKTAAPANRELLFFGWTDQPPKLSSADHPAREGRELPYRFV